MKFIESINYIRTAIILLIIHRLKIRDLIEEDMVKYLWYINETRADKFSKCLNKLLLRNMCFRNLVAFRISRLSKKMSYVFRTVYPIKRDLEIYGEIGGGIAIYHGHGTIINAYKIGKNFSVYQGVTIGKNHTPGLNRDQPIIGDNVAIYTNAVVAGGIKIGDNAVIGAGAVVMRDVPANCIAIGNPCVIKQRK